MGFVENELGTSD